MDDDNIRFIQGLVSSVPELKPLLLEHPDANGELLSHVFMGDVTRFVVATCQELRQQSPSESAPAATLHKIIAILEEAVASGPEKTKELVAASFVENLLGEDAALISLEPFWGSTGELLKRLRAFRGRLPADFKFDRDEANLR